VIHRSHGIICSLAAAGLLLGAAAAQAQDKKEEKKGALVEVQLQDNSRIDIELQEVVPAYNDATRLNFTRQLVGTLDQIAWNQVPILPDPKRGPQVREIRIADEPSKMRDADGTEYLFYPVVIVPFAGTTSSWYWQGANLSGISSDKEPRPVTIPIRDVKVVRFFKEQNP
jgi:hypothetical protein